MSWHHWVPSPGTQLCLWIKWHPALYQEWKNRFVMSSCALHRQGFLNGNSERKSGSCAQTKLSITLGSKLWMWAVPKMLPICYWFTKGFEGKEVNGTFRQALIIHMWSRHKIRSCSCMAGGKGNTEKWKEGSKRSTAESCHIIFGFNRILGCAKSV